MSWLHKLWQRLCTPAPQAEPVQRWVAIDVESSGLDTDTDQLLAIACIALRVDWPTGKLVITPGDSLELVIRPATLVADKDNILIHGIGQKRQSSGLPGPEAMALFTQFIGSAPLLAFHSWFDQRMLDRHLRQYTGQGLPNPWVDIEKLCVVTHQKVQAHSLDEWMAHFGITCTARHQAAADTWAECEVLQRIWPAVAQQCKSWRDVQNLARQERWLRASSA